MQVTKPKLERVYVTVRNGDQQRNARQSKCITIYGTNADEFLANIARVAGKDRKTSRMK